MKNSRYLFVVLGFMIPFLSFCEKKVQSRQIVHSDSLGFDSIRKTEFTILFVGDVMAHGPQTCAAKVGSDSYDYKSCFALVRPYIEKADFAVANLETPLGGKPYQGYPQFSAPDKLAITLKDIGFDLVGLANNHALDRGSLKAVRTDSACRAFGLLTMGVYADASQRNERYPLPVEVKGNKIVFLNYTYGTNGIQVKPPTIVNYIDTLQMKQDIAKAKSLNPDLIIAFMHWGVDSNPAVTSEQEMLGQWLNRQGVRIVIGAHPHIVQTILQRGDDCIAYSLGNFVSNQTKIPRRGGLMLQITFLQDKEGRIEIKKIDKILVWVEKNAPFRNRYQVIPIDKNGQSLPLPTYITSAEKKEIEAYRRKTKI